MFKNIFKKRKKDIDNIEIFNNLNYFNKIMIVNLFILGVFFIYLKSIEKQFLNNIYNPISYSIKNNQEYYNKYKNTAFYLNNNNNTDTVIQYIDEKHIQIKINSKYLKDYLHQNKERIGENIGLGGPNIKKVEINNIDLNQVNAELNNPKDFQDIDSQKKINLDIFLK